MTSSMDNYLVIGGTVALGVALATLLYNLSNSPAALVKVGESSAPASAKSGKKAAAKKAKKKVATKAPEPKPEPEPEPEPELDAKAKKKAKEVAKKAKKVAKKASDAAAAEAGAAAQAVGANSTLVQTSHGVIQSSDTSVDPEQPQCKKRKDSQEAQDPDRKKHKSSKKHKSNKKTAQGDTGEAGPSGFGGAEQGEGHLGEEDKPNIESALTRPNPEESSERADGAEKLSGCSNVEHTNAEVEDQKEPEESSDGCVLPIGVWSAGEDTMDFQLQVMSGEYLECGICKENWGKGRERFMLWPCQHTRQCGECALSIWKQKQLKSKRCCPWCKARIDIRPRAFRPFM